MNEKNWLTGDWVTNDNDLGDPWYWIPTMKNGRRLNLAWFSICTQQDLATREQLDATAKLFAASAEMYDALEAFVSIWSYTDQELYQLETTTSGRGEIDPKTAERIINGRAALARARGEV